jgi:RHS repeat-associated protein
MFGIQGLRCISGVTLFFFTWMTLYPTLAAAARPVPTPPTAASVEEILEDLRDTALRTRSKTERGQNATREHPRLLARAAELDAADAQAEADFAAAERHLETHHLPEAIQQRHRQAVADYRAQRQELKRRLDEFRAVHGRQDPTRAQRALTELADFLHREQKARPRAPFDPKTLPFRSPDDKVRAPKDKQEDLDELVHPPKPVNVAAAELLPGLLAQAEPIPNAAPTSEDLAETEDVQLTQAIRDQAATLHHNPVEIYTWVRNTIEFLPTYGSIQGSDLTLQTRRGNAFDTASLLIALLRASNIPARYVYGTIQVPADQVMNWVGGVKTPEAAQSLLGQGGIPSAAVVSGGKITALTLEHVWVSAFVDYVPSRGAVHRVGDTWVPLDASFKRHGFSQGLDWTSAASFNAQSVIDTVKAGASCDAETARNLDTAPLTDAFLAYRNRLSRVLTAQGADVTVADLLGGRTIVPEAYPILLGTLPYATLQQASGIAALPEELRWRLRYAVFASDLDRSENRPVAQFTAALPRLAAQRATLSFAPASPADEEVLNSYLPSPHPDGTPLQASEFPSSLPGYLIHLRAEVRVDGQVVASGGEFPLGQPLIGTLAHFDPSRGGWTETEHAVNAGEYHALAVDAQGLAAAPLATFQQRLGQTYDALNAGTYPGLDRDGVVGSFLYPLALSYFAVIDAHAAVVAAAADLTDLRLPSYGRAVLRVEPKFAFGLVKEAAFSGLALQVDRLSNAITASGAAGLSYRRQAQQRASGYSHQLLERVLTGPDRPGTAVSTVKALATALQNHVPVWALSAANAAQRLGQIGLDEAAKTDLGNATAAGFEALVQQDPLTFDGYTGGGYTLEDPQTGLGAYRLSTARAGGATGLLFGPAGLGYLALAEPAQAAGPIGPALVELRDVEGQLAAWLDGQAEAGHTRWSAYAGQDEVASALFLRQIAAFDARDACDRAVAVAAAHWTPSAGLPAAGLLDNHVPRITSTPTTAAVAGQPYRYPVQAEDADGDTLTYRLGEAPAGVTVDAATGLLTWNTPVPGSYPVVLRADDGRAYAEQRYTLTVNGSLSSLELTVNVTPAVANAGETVRISVTTAGTSGPVALQATLDGTPLAFDVTGRTSFAAPASGTHRLVVTATDANGPVTRETQYTVRDASDTTPPTAALTAPVQDAEITAPIEITGTANDTHFAYYRLLIRPAGDPDTAWRELARSYTPVTDGRLGRLDPGLLPNGLYDFAIQVVDVNGQSTLASAPVEVLGDLKLGPFRIAFEDLNVDAAGIPVRVVRGYDSLRRHDALDFGWGWSVDYQSTSIRKNMTLGLAWEVTNIFWQMKLCLNPVGKRKIAVTLPDGKVERFTAANAQECGFLQMPPVDIRFTPQPGTTSTLEVVDSSSGIEAWGGMLLDTYTGLPWNPKQFKLTTEEGYAYYLQEGVGIQKIQDPFGNTLTYGRNGIVHSAGLSVAFERDAAGHITRITDPQGKALQYRYNSHGELVAMIDREGKASTFSYARDHLLADYTDPRGVKAAQQIYDDRGRLIALVDAGGQRTELAFEEDAHHQVVTDRLGHKTTYVYDDAGNVTAVTDPLGNTTTYAYDALGNETQVTDSLGHVTTRTFDPKLNKQLTELDPLGNLQSWAYGATVQGEDPRQLKSSTDALGNITTYGYIGGTLNRIYEPLGRTTSMGLDHGNVIGLSLSGQLSRYAYNSQGQRIAETDPAGHVTQYTLDANGRETGRAWTRTDANGQVRTITTRRTLDAEGRVLEETDAAGGVTKRDYNGAGKVTKETDPLGRVTTYDYDLQARLIKTTYPDGTFAATAYDANGNTVSETDRAGRTTRNSYDALNRLVKTTAPDGTSTETIYDAAGRVWKTVEAGGQTTEHTYDAAGRLTAVQGPDGKVTRYEYDANGNRTKTTDPADQVTAFAYDALNRLVKTTYPDGGTATTVWRVDGLKQSETDPAGVTRAYGYDAASRLSQVTESSGDQVTVYAYDEAGNKLRQTDAEGRVTTWTYDDANRLTARTLPGGEKETFQYDRAGRLTAHSDFQGRTTLYGYDDADRRTLARFPDGRSVQWTYTADGQLDTVLDGLGTTRYQYDAQGRVVKETRPDGAVLAWSYDAEGNVTERSSPSGTVRQAYDAAGRLVQVTDPQGKTTAYAYDEAGRLATQTYPNGARATYAYDANSRLTQLRHTQADGTLLTGVAYTLAANGQRTELREFDGQSPVVGGLAQNPLRTTRYGYDGAGRLASEDVTGRDGAVQRTVAYSYDKVGNRTQKTLTTPAGTETTVYGYDTDDRLTAETTTAGGVATTISYGWDSTGRLVKKAEPGQVTLYDWDSEDHLIEVRRGATDATAQTVATYAYDAFGHRVKQVEKTAQGDRVTTYLTDTTFPYAQVVEAKTKLGSQTQTARYVWGAGLIAQVQGGQGRYYHADGLGSVKALSDGTGALTDAYEYEAFGETLSHNGASEQPYRFAGEHYDPVVKMQYHRARWYDINTGRFIVLDPYNGNLARPTTLHKYVYAGGDPVQWSDPSGRMTSIAGVSIALAVGVALMTAATYQPRVAVFGNQTSGTLSDRDIGILTILGSSWEAGQRLVKSIGFTLSLSNNGDGVELYRVVEEPEFMDILSCNCFQIGPNGFPKQFWLDEQSALKYGKTISNAFSIKSTDWTMVSGTISKGLYERLDHSQVDEFIGGSSVTVWHNLIPALNADIKRHGGIKFLGPR